MFGLSMRKKLAALILQRSKDCICQYTEDIKYFISQSNGYSDEQMNAEFINIRRNYLDTVANTVFADLKNMSPNIYSRALAALSTPEICGYPDIDIDNGVAAGKIYAICYYAIMNKIAKPSDCISLNHAQHDIMDQALSKINESSFFN